MALFATAAIIILQLLDTFADRSNPYLGIFIFLIFPGILVLGLLLIPAGMWREHQRRKRGELRPVVLDPRLPAHRNAMVTFGAGTCIFLLLTTVGLYKGYQYTESVEFCGKVCHQVMEPEHTAYFNSAHAKVSCAKCHIGPGADWFVKSKLSGARQVVRVVLGNYERPIPTPVRDLRPAQEVCEHCHWPNKFFDATQVTNDHFLGDEQNTHWQITMLINVGGISSGQGKSLGIHWHVDKANEITYVAADSSRQTFDRVVWASDGRDVVYTPEGEPTPDSVLVRARSLGLERTLDCIDCHNRPSHKYRSPVQAVNEAMASGELDPNIPWIKRRAVRVLSKEYATKEGAQDSIAAGLRGFYRNEGVDLPQAAVAAAQRIYGQNMFPEMRVRWDEYPDNRGHLDFPGCFRCHGSNLKTEQGEGISADCNLCHTIVAQGPSPSLTTAFSPEGLAFQHPLDVDGAETRMPCYDCHIGDESLYLKTQEGKEISGLSYAAAP
jgi:hypothetical protein